MLDNVQDIPVDEQQTNIQEPEQQEQENKFAYEIKYNKEPVVIGSDEELRELAQLGYHYKAKKHDELESYKTELDQLRNQYDSRKPELEYIDGFLKDQGYGSWAEYQRDVEIQKLVEQNIPTEYAEEMLENRAFRQKIISEREQQEKQNKFAQEYMEFEKNFPEVAQKLATAQEGEVVIPNEVFDIQNQTGISLTDAYLRYQWNNREVEKQKLEQEVISKLQNNNQTSTGSATGSTALTGIDFNAMSKEDFAKYQRRVEMGEFTSK